MNNNFKIAFTFIVSFVPTLLRWCGNPHFTNEDIKVQNVSFASSWWAGHDWFSLPSVLLPLSTDLYVLCVCGGGYVCVIKPNIYVYTQRNTNKCLTLPFK